MAPDDPKDPRFARYRLAALALYLVLTIGFSGLIIISVFRSVAAMSPKAPAAAQSLSERACATQARAMYDELDTKRRTISTEPNVATSDLRWSEFRLDWLTRVRQLEAQCDLQDPSREKLKHVFKQLDHVLDLFTVQAVQFAGEIGPSLDAIRSSLESVEH
jgi:hypothetical protein